MDSSIGRHEKTTPKSLILQPGGMKKTTSKISTPIDKKT
jgi:hypothetical protein